MKIGIIPFYAFMAYALVHFNVIDLRPVRGFVNSPFDEESRLYPQFFQWKKEYEGKYNIIFLKYGRLIRPSSLRSLYKRLPSRPNIW